MRSRTALLEARIAPLIIQCRPKVLYRLVNVPSEKRLVMWLWYPYDEKAHKNRKFTSDDGNRKLDGLKASEMNVLSKIVADIAGNEFETEFVLYEDGKVEYLIIPKNLG